MSAEWECIIREKDSAKKYFPLAEVVDHPLKSFVTLTESREYSSSTGNKNKAAVTAPLPIPIDPLSLSLEGLDPLNHFIRIESVDPLSQLASDYEQDELANEKNNPDSSTEVDGAITPNRSWTKYRTSILTRFTTAEKLTIVSSYLSGVDMIKTQTTISEKMKCRLEQLDDFDDGSVQKIINLTQQEYQFRIEQLNQELVHAWKTDQRVRSLKIAIQCSKLLADTSVLQFYPSQFVFITDILDIFGNLVYTRLRTKAVYFEPGSKVSKELPLNFTTEMVPEAVKETCLNWFYKIASIRELLPRLYVEIALLKSYSFLTQSEFNQALLRLTRIIRGIGDPLVAAYARCYLVRVGMTVTTDNKYIIENLNDFLFVYHTMFCGGIRAEISHQKIDLTSYLALYEPAINWILQSLSTSPIKILDEFMDKCKDKKNNALLIGSILTTFTTPYIASRATEFVKTVASTQVDGITKGQLLRSLGKRLCECAVLEDNHAEVFHGAWKTINTLTNANEYIQSVEPWTEYVGTYVGLKELDDVLKEIIARMSNNRNAVHYVELQSICNKIIDCTKDLEALLVSEHFLPLIDLLQKESVRMEICKNIMTAFKRKRCSTECSDAVLINALMYICKILNDTTNALSGEDERRQVSQLISYFIKIVDYKKDFEQQLSFFVEARTAFPNLDAVLVTLVHCVNLLATNTHRIVNGVHTRKTAAFVRGCVAYCFITIPSISSVTARMDLYLLSGQIALTNHCLGQADSCFEATIKLIVELPKTVEIDGKWKSSETYLVQFVTNLLSTLIIVPDNPEQGVLYLVRTLLEAIKLYPFDSNGSSLATIYLHTLDMLTTAAQDSYPYHIPNLISNDELYGSDPKFIKEINIICSQVVELILVELKTLGDAQQLQTQSQLSLELFCRIAFNANLCVEKTLLLANNLWSLAMKNRSLVNEKLPGQILIKVERLKGKTLNQDLRHALEKLTSKMKMKM